MHWGRKREEPEMTPTFPKHGYMDCRFWLRTVKMWSIEGHPVIYAHVPENSVRAWGKRGKIKVPWSLCVPSHRDGACAPTPATPLLVTSSLGKVIIRYYLSCLINHVMGACTSILNLTAPHRITDRIVCVCHGTWEFQPLSHYIPHLVYIIWYNQKVASIHWAFCARLSTPLGKSSLYFVLDSHSNSA